MKKLGILLFVTIMLTLILLLGSCSPASASLVSSPVLVDASASSLLRSGSSGPSDSTAFLVGEFTGENGSVARFNGHGEVTMVNTVGESTVGTYNMLEYEAQQATVSIELYGVTTVYDFALLSGQGDFSLTDSTGNVYSFTPVAY